MSLRRLPKWVAWLCLAVAGVSCNQAQVNKSDSTAGLKAVGEAVAVAFDEQGRLWRLVPGKEHAYVDYSTDFGRRFSTPVMVDPTPRRIAASPENPPVIAVGPDGGVAVLYFADEAQPLTSYFSYSADGVHFSAPVRVSDHAESAMHYMDAMVVDERGRPHLFWHDLRDASDDRNLGESVLSLYYGVADDPKEPEFVNRKVTGGVCSCCRTPVAMDRDDKPVAFVRMVFEGAIRDHGVVKMTPVGATPVRRVTYDDWKIDACPEHGPAFAIADDGRYHMAWMTLGERRKGIFYAHSDDQGQTLSTPMGLGDGEQTPGHPAVLAQGRNVVLAWMAFDGDVTKIMARRSTDGGATFAAPRAIARSADKTGYPQLVGYGGRAFLSWYARDEGHLFLEIDKL